MSRRDLAPPPPVDEDVEEEDAQEDALTPQQQIEELNEMLKEGAIGAHKVRV